MSDTRDLGPSREQVLAGTATYTRRVLSIYDILVLGHICRRVWRCDRSVMLAMYNDHIGARHLDLGPGTGFFLDRCQHRAARPAIALVDLNPTVLAKAATRLRRYSPATYERDVLAPFDAGGEQFDSAGLNFLLHCLPGGMEHKAKVLDHARRHVRPGGRIFGSTVLAQGVEHSARAVRLLDSLNQKGTFDNRGDSLNGLEDELAKRFSSFSLSVRGSVALFDARS